MNNQFSKNSDNSLFMKNNYVKTSKVTNVQSPDTRQKSQKDELYDSTLNSVRKQERKEFMRQESNSRNQAKSIIQTETTQLKDSSFDTNLVKRKK